MGDSTQQPQYDYQELALQLQLAGLLDDKSVVGAAGNEDVLKALVDGKLVEHALTVNDDGKTFADVKNDAEGADAEEGSASAEQGDTTQEGAAPEQTPEDLAKLADGKSPDPADAFGEVLDAPAQPRGAVSGFAAMDDAAFQPPTDIGENGQAVASTSQPPAASPTAPQGDVDTTTLKQTPAVEQQGIVDQSAPAAPAPVTEKAPYQEPPTKTELAEKRMKELFPQFSAGNAAGRVTRARLDEYVTAMDMGKPMDVPAGVRWQGTLYRMVVGTINRNDQFFRENFEDLLKLIQENPRGVFGPTAIFRFVDQLEMTLDDRKAFECLLHLLTMVADPRGRQVALKQIDVEMALRYGVTEQGRQRVADYLQVSL
jgi:hypothetical protein